MMIINNQWNYFKIAESVRNIISNIYLNVQCICLYNSINNIKYNTYKLHIIILIIKYTKL